MAMEDGDLLVEASLRKAVKARAAFIREQAESITLERLRRLLEKDMQKESFQLDSCKRLIKHLVDEVLSSDEQTEVLDSAVENLNGNSSKTAGKKDREEDFEVSEGQETAEVLEKLEVEEEPQNDESGKMGKAECLEQKDRETSVREAISKRAFYLKENSESITLQQLRRLLEIDIGLQEFELDSQKQLVKKLVDEILHTTEESSEDLRKGKKRKEEKEREKSKVYESTNGEKKSGGGKKRAKKDGARNDVASKYDKGSYDEESNDEKPKASSKKSADMKPVYNKHIERLRQIIKACGSSISPNVYRKVKQVPEHERDQALEKELEVILSREGLSVNASEKEIKAARRRRERQKDLEDIDTKNIIMEPRGRRQASLFFSPPVYKEPIRSQPSSDEEDENGASSNEDALSPVEDQLVDESD